MSRLLPLISTCLISSCLTLPAAANNSTQSSADSRKQKLPSPPDGAIPKYQKVRTTAYTHTESDHIQYGRKNALGTRLRLDKYYTSAASDWSKYPVGTKFRMKGKDTVYVIDDYGSALVGTGTIDIYHPTKRAMWNWGVRHVEIEIIELGDFEKSREILAERTRWRHCRKMLAAIPDHPVKLWNPAINDQPDIPVKSPTAEPDLPEAPLPEIAPEMRLAYLRPIPRRDLSRAVLLDSVPVAPAAPPTPDLTNPPAVSAPEVEEEERSPASAPGAIFRKRAFTPIPRRGEV
ncbi:MAG: 3D domain-containing protein [Verrucomicrobiales bacterium]|nr:3D domain-containing protein [Verrucomicrobiales bacterium]